MIFVFCAFFLDDCIVFGGFTLVFVLGDDNFDALKICDFRERERGGEGKKISIWL